MVLKINLMNKIHGIWSIMQKITGNSNVKNYENNYLSPSRRLQPLHGLLLYADIIVVYYASVITL